MITLRSSRPVARKAHYCDLCGTKILPGQSYDRQTNVFDGRVYDWKMCLECVLVLSAVFDWLGDFAYDQGVGTDEADEWSSECPGDPLAVAYRERRGTGPAGC